MRAEVESNRLAGKEYGTDAGKIVPAGTARQRRSTSHVAIACR